MNDIYIATTDMIFNVENCKCYNDTRYSKHNCTPHNTERYCDEMTTLRASGDTCAILQLNATRITDAVPKLPASGSSGHTIPPPSQIIFVWLSTLQNMDNKTSFPHKPTEIRSKYTHIQSHSAPPEVLA